MFSLSNKRGICVYCLLFCFILMTFCTLYISPYRSIQWGLNVLFTDTGTSNNVTGLLRSKAQMLFTKYEDDLVCSMSGRCFQSCPNVADRMVIGYWQKNSQNYTKEELTMVDEAMRWTYEANSLPISLERQDQKCGNVKLADKNEYFRALCEPEGRTPCCFNYLCVNKSVEQCRGPWTYDLRQQVQTEFATWTPEDPTCKVVNVSTEERACHVINNVTIYFIGESLTRQLFISLLGFLRDAKHTTHVLAQNSSQAMRCHRYFRYSPACTDFILQDTVECDGKTRLRYRRLLNSEDAAEMLNQFRELSGRPNSWYVAGFGYHSHFEYKPVINEILYPILQEMTKSPWPKFVWLATHMPPVLQAMYVPHQQPTEILQYNEQLKIFLSEHNVPVLDFTQMTVNARAIDNIHYGKGVNDAKATILLNLILEQRHNYTKLSEKQVSRLSATTQQTTTKQATSSATAAAVATKPP